MSYNSNVRNGVYTGEDAQVAECFAQVDKLRVLVPQMKAILAAGKEVKGTLNEDQYQTLLGVNMDCPDQLCRIVRQQEHRRADYFRIRMLLEHHVLPAIKEAVTRLIPAAAEVAQRKNQWTAAFDNLSAIGEAYGVLEGTLEIYQRARDFVAEGDATAGRGEESFERKAKSGESYWSPSAIPEEFLLVQGVEAHPLDQALQAAIKDIRPQLAQFASDVEELKRASHYDRTKQGPTASQRARWAELFPRVRHNVRMGSDFDGWDPGFTEREGAALTKAIKELTEALPTIESKPQRWLAQSNLLACSRVITQKASSLETDAFNMTVGAGCVHSDMSRTTVRSFTQLLPKIQEDLATL